MSAPSRSSIGLFAAKVKTPLALALLLALCLGLGACGRKPGDVDAPEGRTTYTYPPAAQDIAK